MTLLFESRFDLTDKSRGRIRAVATYLLVGTKGTFYIRIALEISVFEAQFEFS